MARSTTLRWAGKGGSVTQPSEPTSLAELQLQQMQALLQRKARPDSSLDDFDDDQLAMQLHRLVKLMDATSADRQDTSLPLTTRVTRSLEAEQHAAAVVQALFSEREQAHLLGLLVDLLDDPLAPDDQPLDEWLGDLRSALFG